MSANNPEGITCPTCQTVNEAGWAFCQQCGSKLPQAAPPPVERRDPTAERTIVAQPFVNDPRYPPPQNSPWGSPEPPATQESRLPLGMPTVVDTPAPPPSSYNDPTVNEPRRPLGYPTVPEQAPYGQPAPPNPPPQGPPPYGQQTVPNQMPPLGQPTVANQVPLGQQTVPNQIPDAAQSTEVARPAGPQGRGGPSCQNCGTPAAPGAAFCASCGAAMPVPKTIVMHSVPAPAARARLHLILEGGGQGEVYDVKDETTVGRTVGDITFPHDGFMSGRHARIVQRGNSYFVEDAGSRNGTFIKIKGAVELKSGDMILIGKQLFRFEV